LLFTIPSALALDSSWYSGGQPSNTSVLIESEYASSYSHDNGWITVANMIDGDFDTSTCTVSSSAILEQNYTKPSGNILVTSATITKKDECGTQQIIIPETSFDYYTSILRNKLVASPESLIKLEYYFFNGSYVQQTPNGTCSGTAGGCYYEDKIEWNATKLCYDFTNGSYHDAACNKAADNNWNTRAGISHNESYYFKVNSTKLFNANEMYLHVLTHVNTSNLNGNKSYELSIKNQQTNELISLNNYTRSDGLNDDSFIESSSFTTWAEPEYIDFTQNDYPFSESGTFLCINSSVISNFDSINEYANISIFSYFPSGSFDSNTRRWSAKSTVTMYNIGNITFVGGSNYLQCFNISTNLSQNILHYINPTSITSQFKLRLSYARRNTSNAYTTLKISSIYLVTNTTLYNNRIGTFKMDGAGVSFTWTKTSCSETASPFYSCASDFLTTNEYQEHLVDFYSNAPNNNFSGIQSFSYPKVYINKSINSLSQLLTANDEIELVISNPNEINGAGDYWASFYEAEVKYYCEGNCTEPTISNLQIIPSIPVDNQNLTCNYTWNDNASTDNSYISWFVNNTLYSSGDYINTTILESLTNIGDNWTCQVTPHNNIVDENGTAVNSSSVKVRGTEPILIISSYVFTASGTQPFSTNKTFTITNNGTGSATDCQFSYIITSGGNLDSFQTLIPLFNLSSSSSVNNTIALNGVSTGSYVGYYRLNCSDYLAESDITTVISSNAITEIAVGGGGGGDIILPYVVNYTIEPLFERKKLRIGSNWINEFTITNHGDVNLDMRVFTEEQEYLSFSEGGYSVNFRLSALNQFDPNRKFIRYKVNIPEDAKLSKFNITLRTIVANVSEGDSYTLEINVIEGFFPQWWYDFWNYPLYTYNGVELIGNQTVVFATTSSNTACLKEGTCIEVMWDFTIFYATMVVSALAIATFIIYKLNTRKRGVVG
jgi:hypothetical protein